MPNTEHDQMDRGFEWRLKAALDRVTPPLSSPRYASAAMGGARAWPIGPALVAAGAAMVLLAVTATATTGSYNPAVWAERAGTTIQSVGHTSESAPSQEPGADTHRSAPVNPAQPSHEPAQNQKSDTPEAPQKAEKPDQPEPNEQAEPSDPSIHSGLRPAPESPQN
jgi:outer membrane biosynthesis protein TonB